MIENKKSIIVLVVVWVIALATGGIYYNLKSTSKVVNSVKMEKKEKSFQATGKFEKVKFYSPDKDYKELVVKSEEIPVYYKKRDKVEKIAEISFENLYTAKLLATPQIDVKNVYITGDTVYIDCDANIMSLKEANRKNILGIYSVVNSITEIPGIKKVKILVDEKEEGGNFGRVYTRNMNF